MTVCFPRRGVGQVKVRLVWIVLLLRDLERGLVPLRSEVVSFEPDDEAVETAEPVRHVLQEEAASDTFCTIRLYRTLATVIKPSLKSDIHLAAHCKK